MEKKPNKMKEILAPVKQVHASIITLEKALREWKYSEKEAYPLTRVKGLIEESREVAKKNRNSIYFVAVNPIFRDLVDLIKKEKRKFNPRLISSFDEFLEGVEPSLKKWTDEVPFFEEQLKEQKEEKHLFQ